VDTVSEDLWKQVNKPHKDLKLDAILDGISNLVKICKGKVVSETMLIDGISYEDEAERIAEFLKNLERLDKAYIAVPTRPPAKKGVKPVSEETINAAFQVFSEKLGANKVECLIGYEGNAFAFTGNLEEDLLSITAVHPMREEAVKALLKKANADWSIIERLLQEKELKELEYEGHLYYMRKL